MNKVENSEKGTTLTVLGQNTSFEGDLDFTDNLCITGKFKGRIHTKGDVRLSKTASCEVSTLTASSVIIEGKITGDIEAKSKAELCSSSVVKGNISTSLLRIEESAYFDGKINMLENSDKVAEDALASEEIFKKTSAEFRSSLVMKTQQVE